MTTWQDNNDNIQPLKEKKKIILKWTDAMQLVYFTHDNIVTLNDYTHLQCLNIPKMPYQNFRAKSEQNYICRFCCIFLARKFKCITVKWYFWMIFKQCEYSQGKLILFSWSNTFNPFNPWFCKFASGWSNRRKASKKECTGHRKQNIIVIFDTQVCIHNWFYLKKGV